MAIRAIIFDLFDVLFCAENLTERHAFEARIGLSINGLEHAMFRSPLFREAIRGEIPEAELWRDVARSVHVDPGKWQMLADIFYSAIRVNTDLVAFIRTLRPRYRTAILSNAPSAVETLITQRFHLDREVDTVVISSKEGVTKPHPESYLLAASRLKVQPQEAIFVDDETRFVDAAKAIGMQGMQFKDTKQTIAEIQSYFDYI